MRTLFIVNPAAGHGRGEARFHSAARALPGGWVSRITERAGDGERLAREAVEEGFERVVACGGDGTLGEALNGFLSAPEEKRARSALGTWPAGSGCDTARHFGIASTPEALAAVAAAEPQPVDVGRVTFAAQDGKTLSRWFVNVASFGVAGEVARRVAASGKPLGGALSYLVTSVGALLTTPARDIELLADGAALPRGKVHLVSVANTSSTGGGMLIAPGADASDGALDLVIVGDLSRPRLLAEFPRVYAGAHLGRPGVTARRIRRLEARSAERVYLNIDGEAVGVLPAAFEVLPKALPFLRS